MRKALNTIPEGLHDIYREAIQVIHGLDGDRRKLALDVLAWIFSAARPLNPRELQEAVALEEDDTTLEADFLTDESTLIDICGGLVTIDEHSRTVRFVHYSVQEYFEKNPDILYGSHSLIAKTCLTYLSLGYFEESLGPLPNPLYSRLHDYALYSYAAVNWGFHTSFVQDDPQILEKIRAFSGSGHRVGSALYTFFVHSEHRTKAYIPNSHNILHLAARFDLFHVAQFCIDQCNLPAGRRDSIDGKTPLTVAAANGYQQVVRFLAERADVHTDSEDRSGRTPLSWAASKGHQEVVRFLAERSDVDADSKDRSGKPPLSWAALKGHQEVVRYLAERDDVDADSKDHHERTPLSRAAYNGHHEVVRYLAETDDVDADSKDLRGRTPLWWAAWNGHEEVVRLLAARGDVDTDPKDHNGRTPFWRVAQYGHEAVVQALQEIISCRNAGVN